MRFMVLVPADKNTEADVLPTHDEFVAMGRFQEEMVKAGVALSGEGLRSTKYGARVRFGGGGKTTVIDGPFTESKEVIAGFWIMQTKSLEEAIAWTQRAPFREGTQLEIRRIFEDDDFAASDTTGELRAKDAELRAKAMKKA